MKHLLIATVLSAAAFCTANANDQKYFDLTKGSGYTKGDAIASALLKVPFGAKVEKINVNGYAVHQCVKGAGYVQTYGSHKATVHYSR
jgi:hypothetical protein